MSAVGTLNINRRAPWGLAAALLLPLVFLAVASLFVDDGSEDKALAAAATSVKAYYADNPPNGLWVATGVRVTDDKRVMVDVDVTKAKHANVIRSRNKRIQYSYLKLACPPSEAPISRVLVEGSALWINLHFEGATILEGACPSDTESGLL